MKIKVCYFDVDVDEVVEHPGFVDFELSEENLTKLDAVVRRWEATLGCIDQGGDGDYQEFDCVELCEQDFTERDRNNFCFLFRGELENAVRKGGAL